jgi:HEAT repeat protein
MYRRHQDDERAIAELRRALSKNDRLFSVYFDLAELLLSRGEIDEADRLLRRVVRAAPDDDLVARAARLCMQVNLGRGTLESFERDLLPIALGNPSRPVFRRLLVEVYGNLAFPLVEQLHSGGRDRAAAAKEALHRIGERAVQPLLDALSDERDSQQRTAIELLSYVSNPSAGPALVAFATGKADEDLRMRAMLAASALSDPALLPRLEAVLAPSGNVRFDGADVVATAAAWGVAHMRNQRAHGLLVRLLSSDAPSIRALGAIGIGVLGNRADARLVQGVARSVDYEPIVRAAAAFALGALGDTSARDTLSELTESSDPLLRQTALLALSRLRAPQAQSHMATALVASDPGLRAAAADGLVALSTHDYRVHGDPLPVPDGRVDVAALLAAQRPSGYTDDERARAVVEFGGELTNAAVTAAQSGPAGAEVVAEALLARRGKPSFAPLTDGLDGASEANRAAAEATLGRIEAALVESFVALTRHPSPALRTRAIAVLAARAEPAAQNAIVAALSDTDANVQRASLSALATSRAEGALAAVAKLSQSADEWAVRARATETLGAIAANPDAHAAIDALAQVAEKDTVAFVREGAIRALAGAGDTARAQPVLRRIADSDPEPRVRLLAKTLLTLGKEGDVRSATDGAH